MEDVGERACLLSEEDRVDSAVTALTRFMASRCFVHTNKSGTVRGYLAAIKHFRKMSADGNSPLRIA